MSIDYEKIYDAYRVYRTLRRKARLLKSKRLKELFSKRKREELEGLSVEEKIKELEKLGKEADLPCYVCGRSAKFDIASIIYLAKMFGIEPESLLICPDCRSNEKWKEARKAIRKVKRKARKGELLKFERS